MEGTTVVTFEQLSQKSAVILQKDNNQVVVEEIVFFYVPQLTGIMKWVYTFGKLEYFHNIHTIVGSLHGLRITCLMLRK